MSSTAAIARHGTRRPLRGKAVGGTGTAGAATVTLGTTIGNTATLEFKNDTPHFLRVVGWRAEMSNTAHHVMAHLRTGPNGILWTPAAGRPGIHSKFFAVQRGEAGFPLEWEVDGGRMGGRIIPPNETVYADFAAMTTDGPTVRMELITHTMAVVPGGGAKPPPPQTAGQARRYEAHQIELAGEAGPDAGDKFLLRRGGLSVFIPLASTAMTEAQMTATSAELGRVRIAAALGTIGPLTLPIQEYVPRGYHVVIHGIFAFADGDFDFRTEGGDGRLSTPFSFVDSSTFWGAGQVDSNGYLHRPPFAAPLEVIAGDEEPKFYLRDVANSSNNDIQLLAACSVFESTAARLQGARL